MSNRDVRPPVRWSTHSMQVLLVASVVIGGTLFGLAFALWPTSTFELWLGRLILAGVAAAVVGTLAYLRRPTR